MICARLFQNFEIIWVLRIFQNNSEAIRIFSGFSWLWIFSELSEIYFLESSAIFRDFSGTYVICSRLFGVLNIFGISDFFKTIQLLFGFFRDSRDFLFLAVFTIFIFQKPSGIFRDFSGTFEICSRLFRNF